MQAKSITAPQNPQAPDGKVPPVHFTSAQRQVVIDLLKAERSHASAWWMHLHEMRCRSELPTWAKTNSVGDHPDYDRWSADCAETNFALLGTRAHLNGFDVSPGSEVTL